MSEYNDDAWDEYLSTGIDPTDGDLGTDEDDDPSVSYATVYPVGMFLRVITAQMIMLLCC